MKHLSRIVKDIFGKKERFYGWSNKNSKPKSRKVPIYKGCIASENGGCLCTGECKEIVGYRDKMIGEN